MDYSDYSQYVKKGEVESIWYESSDRPAGYRQTLKIGRAVYGFVWIPAGEFDMGSPESEEYRHSDEVLHHVKLTKGFWMLETEVTQTLYREVIGTNPSWFKTDDPPVERLFPVEFEFVIPDILRPKASARASGVLPVEFVLPVERVSWYDAMDFCKELTSRLRGELKASLPTEAQWEYSCRAGTKTAYWYGDSADYSKMNCHHAFSGNNHKTTTPVKQYDPNPWGLYDIHGNVFEWCLDCDEDYPAVNPDPKDDVSRHVVRGGSWSVCGFDCRSAYRFHPRADFKAHDLGFRFLLSCD